jgi:hypothetical protein
VKQTPLLHLVIWLGIVELQFHSSIGLHGVVLNELSIGTILHLLIQTGFKVISVIEVHIYIYLHVLVYMHNIEQYQVYIK